MVVTLLPLNVFADSGLEMAPAKGPTGVKDAEGDIESGTIANDAPNAVHAFVGVQTGGDANLPLAGATGQQFKPIQGVKAYFQWFEDGGYVSPVYSAVSDANGRLNIDCKPYVASDGKIIKFDADPTVSGGHEKYRFWVEQSTIPSEYQLQYITGEQVIFPLGIATITQGGSGSNTAKNTHENWKILLMQKPKAEMHKAATPTQNEANGGYIKGKVSWDYNSPSGGVQWKYIAHQSTPAEGVTVKASYLSDYAMKKIYSDDMAVKLSLSGSSAIRGKGWTSKLEGQLQDEIKKQMKGEEDKWIAETVSAVTNSEGDYILQFNGTWGYKQNADVAKGYTEQAGKWGWTQPALDRLGTVAAKASDGSFNDAALNYNEKHINLDWLFVSTEGTEDLRVMTPYNNNWYTAMNSDWGIHSGWSGASVAKEFSVGVTNIANRSMKSDFVFGINKVNFNITNYDSRANTAIPGDIAQTSTTGLPYSNTSDKYRIVWYDQDGNEVKTGSSAQPSSTGTLPSCPLDTETDIQGGVKKTTEFTAKLYRVDSKGKNAELIAVDSFTVEVSHLFISRYDDVSIANPKANDKEMAEATYSATGLPADLTIGSKDGTISGKAKEAGLYKVNFKTVLKDPSGNIEGTRDRYIAVTDSPLAAGEVGKAYSQDVKPVPEKDPKNRAYIYKMKSVSFISGKEVAGLQVEGDATIGFKITGTPTAEVKATEDVGEGLLGPNVEVTYDIYKTNDAGDEVLVKENHKDLVPLVVEDEKDNSKYEPEYTAVNGTVGTPATVAAPTFKDTDGQPATPQNVTYELGQGAPTGAQVNADGSVTYTPVEADAGQTVNIPVVVKYSDGTTDKVNAPINVAEKKSTADQVKELGGLSPQTIKVWVRDQIDWSKGVKATTEANKDKVAALLKGAKITDTEKPERNSQTSGKKSGKLLVKFADGSTLEVEKQMLIVSDHIVTVDPNDPDAPKEEDLPSDKIEVRFLVSTGVKSITTTGKTYAKEGTVFQDTDFPQDITFKEGFKGPVTWIPKDRKVTTSSKAYDKRQGYFGFRASAGKTVIPTDPTNPDTPQGYVLVTFEKGSHGTLSGIDKDGKNVTKADKLAFNVKNTATWKDMAKYIPTAVAEGEWKVADPAWDPQIPAEGTTVTAGKYTAQYAEDKTTPTADKDNYDPHYTGKSGKPGETVQIDPPTFTKKGVTGNVPAPTGTTFTKNDDKQTNVTVNPNTGAITVDIPEDAKVGDVITIPVDVTYPDGSNETVEVTVTVRDSEDETEDPTIDQPYEGDDKITGKGEPGSDIVVTDEDGNPIGKTTVDEDGNWTVDVPADKPLKPGDVIKATQTDKDGNTKDATAIVKGRYTPEPEKPYDPGHWYEPSPDYLNKNEYKPVVKDPEHRELDVFSLYMIGNDSHMFMPHKGITRAEVAQIFARALRYDGYQRRGEYNPYSDVNANAWYYDAVITTTEAGVFRGTDKGTFEPNREITKAELIATIARFQELINKDGNTFNMRPNHWARPEVEAAFQEGWLDIYTNGTVVFDADMVITRAEVASILNRAFGRHDDVNYINDNIESLVRFEDVSRDDWFYYDVIVATNTYATFGSEWINHSNGLDREFTNLDDIEWIRPLRDDKEVIESLRRVKFQRYVR